MPRTRLLTALLAWAVAVVGATAIGLTAVGAIGAGIVGTPQRPLSAGEVESLLAATPTPVPSPPAGAPPVQAPPSPSSTGPDPTTTSPAPQPEPGPAEVIASPGGTVVARCVAGRPVVVSATSAQGFRVEDEPGEDPGRVRFEAEDSEVEVRLSCRDSRPVAEIRADD